MTQRAKTFGTLGFAGGRSVIAGEIFRSCNAHKLCDDGHHLVDGGINKQRRLWLADQFDSLTDYNGRQNYTTMVALLSIAMNDQCESELFFGFDWQRPETLSRLIFDETDATLAKTVFSDDVWHAVHRLPFRTITQ